MVEDFYGAHLAFARVEVEAREEFVLFVDGIYRETDEDNSLLVLSGEHDFLLMGKEGYQLFARETIDCPEGSVQNLKARPYDLIRMLYLGNPLDIKIDGSIEDWEDLGFRIYDSPGDLADKPFIDIEWIQLAADSKKIYVMTKTTEPLGSFPYRLDVIFKSPDHDSGLMFSRNDNGGIVLGEYAGDTGTGDNRGIYAESGSYIEYSGSIDALKIERENPNELMLRTIPFPGDQFKMSERLLLTADPLPKILWLNKSWKPGGSGSQATYQVMKNLYLNARTGGKWDKKLPLQIELDCGDNKDRVLRLDNKTLTQQGSEVLNVELKNKGDSLELRIPLESLGDTPQYANLMRITQTGGNEIAVLPYY